MGWLRCQAWLRCCALGGREVLQQACTVWVTTSGACALQAQMCCCVQSCVQRATDQAAVADMPAVAVTCDCLGFCWACGRVRTPPVPAPLRKQKTAAQQNKYTQRYSQAH